jgi:uncharacterized membrane protein
LLFLLALYRQIFVLNANYLGEWVEITGKISQAGDIIKEIEIEKLKKITKLGQINIAFGDNP